MVTGVSGQPKGSQERAAAVCLLLGIYEWVLEKGENYRNSSQSCQLACCQLPVSVIFLVSGMSSVTVPSGCYHAASCVFSRSLQSQELILTTCWRPANSWPHQDKKEPFPHLL